MFPRTQRAETGLVPEDGDAQVVSCSDVWRFDVVTEQDQGDEQVVDVGLVNGEEHHGHVLLERRDEFWINTDNSSVKIELFYVTAKIIFCTVPLRHCAYLSKITCTIC